MCEYLDVAITVLVKSKLSIHPSISVFIFHIVGLAGSPFFQKWHRTWLSLDNDGESIRLYKSEPSESGKLPPTRGSFFTTFLVFAKDRNDEEMSFTGWPADTNARCFVMATHDNIYYLVAESEEDKK